MQRIQTTIGALVGDDPPVTADTAATVAEAIRLMKGGDRDCILVTAEGRLVGIFTQRDLLNRVLHPGLDPAGTPLSEVMTPDPERLKAKDSCAWALARMSDGGFRNVAVVDGEHPVGIVSVRDVMAHLSELIAELEEPDPDESMNEWRDTGGGG